MVGSNVFMVMFETILHGYFHGHDLFDISFQNLEAEKQVKFFQGCVAAAFAERDNSVMEVIIATLFSSSPSFFLFFNF